MTDIEEIALKIHKLNFSDMYQISSEISDILDDRFNTEKTGIDAHQMALLLSDWASNIVDEWREDTHP